MDIEDAVGSAWETAAQDLGIEVSTHGALRDPRGRLHPYTVHVSDFGATNGTICVVGYDETDVVHRLAVEQGFYFSSLFSSYATYDRERFIETLNDWQW